MLDRKKRENNGWREKKKRGAEAFCGDIRGENYFSLYHSNQLFGACPKDTANTGKCLHIANT